MGEYGVLRYYRNTGDLALLQQCYPAIKRYLLDVWQTNSAGLVIHRDGQWDWEDWGDDIDEPLLDNTWYFLALNAAAQMAPLVGQAADAPLFSSLAQGISNQFNAAFWTGTAYRSPTNTVDTDERGNAVAVLAGLTGPSQAAALRTVLVTEQHCSPYMEKYVLEALFTLGYPDDALARMRSRYTAMISSSSTTLWELFPASGGFNHGWSGGPLTLLDEQVAGVTPTAPGFATFDVRPALGTTLSRAGVNVPPPQGLICVLASRNVNNYRLSVRVPPGSAGRVFGLHIRMAITTQAARLRTFVAETPWGRRAPPWETPRTHSAPPWEKCGRGEDLSSNRLSETSAAAGIRAAKKTTHHEDGRRPGEGIIPIASVNWYYTTSQWNSVGITGMPCPCSRPGTLPPCGPRGALGPPLGK